MAKFTKNEKIQAVIRYQNGTEGIKLMERSIEVDHSVLLNWVRSYEYHGEKAFEKGYTSYTLQYKLDVLNYMREQGTSIRETAAIFNIPTHFPHFRIGKCNWGGLDALEPKKKGRPSMKKSSNDTSNKQKPAEGTKEALQAEIDRLRMENAYLKKLNTLVQNKEKSPRKTKSK